MISTSLKFYKKTDNMAYLGICLNLFLGLRIGELIGIRESYGEVALTLHAKMFLKMIIEWKIRHGISDDNLLINTLGKPMHSESIDKALRTVNEALHTPQKGNHSLRKTAASTLKATGMVPDAEIQKTLRHKSISTTQNSYIYGNMRNEVRKKFFTDVYNEVMNVELIREMVEQVR